MEIPYIVEARKDTGLTNSKIAIWLFLASEVMLFGGLFSAYIFLRLGADFPWPERALPILPGLINTAILIASSVTVVFAWAELKLRNWRMFQVYMGITILCAVVFMALKIPIEYKSKFDHQAIRTNDFAVLEGHVLEAKEKGGKKKHINSLGNYLRVGSGNIETFRIHPEVETFKHKVKGFRLSANVTRFYPNYYENILSQVKDHQFNTLLYLGDNPKAYLKIGDEIFDKSTPLTVETLFKFRDFFVKARTVNNRLNAKYLTRAWDIFRQQRSAGDQPAFEGKPDNQCLDPVKEIQGQLIAKNIDKYLNVAEKFDPIKERNRVVLSETVNFIIEGEGELRFVPAKGNFGGGTTITYSWIDEPVLENSNDQKKLDSLASLDAADAVALAKGIKTKPAKFHRAVILHRDKTEVRGEYKTAEVERDGKGMVRMVADENGRPEVVTKVVKTVKSGIELAVDQINLQHFVMKWERDDKHAKPPLAWFLGEVDENGKYTKGRLMNEIDIFQEDKTLIDYYTDPNEKAALQDRIKSGASIRQAWATHMQWVHWRSKELEKKGLEITDFERYVVTWAQLVGYGHKEVGYDLSTEEQYLKYNEISPKWYSSLKGANHYKKEWEKCFPYVFIPRDQIRLESNLTPKWNNYYAIYFTITGLHGLHVIGGALVLGYYLFFGRKMFDSNPEWLANRVEVGGLFWHFVDLVWIFAFPIFYLM